MTTSFPHDADAILRILDSCCDTYTFPMLDNGYVYLAASRLSLHRSAEDWAMVIEIFGFFHRAGFPDVCVHTFGSRLHERNGPERYCNSVAYQAYLANNPNNDSRPFFPMAEGSWIDEDDPGTVLPTDEVTLRGVPIALPSVEQYHQTGIDLLDDRPRVFELCRFLAHHHRDKVLATPVERRVSVPPELTELLVLDDWSHPEIAEGILPSDTETFRQLAEVLASGDISLYHTDEPRNTHWSNWPDGGAL